MIVFKETSKETGIFILLIDSGTHSLSNHPRRCNTPK